MRTSSTVGVFSDLNIGGGNTIHADFNWQGDENISGPVAGVSVDYQRGNVVVYRGTVYISTQDNNDNIVPTTPAAPGMAMPAWTPIGDSSGITAEVAAWDGNVAYEMQDLVYFADIMNDPNAPSLLYVAVAPISQPDQTANPIVPNLNPVNNAQWLRVGGQDITIGVRSDSTTESAVTVTTGGTAGTVIDFGSAANVTAFLAQMYFDLNSNFATNPPSTPGGNFYQPGAGESLVLTFTGAGVGATDAVITISPAGPQTNVVRTGTDSELSFSDNPAITAGMYTLSGVHTVRTVNPTLHEGMNVSFDVDNAGQITVNADQRTVSAAAPITYNPTSGVFGLTIDSQSLEIVSDALRVNLDDNNDLGAGASLERTADGLRANYRAHSQTEETDLEFDTGGTTGLFSRPYTFTAEENGNVAGLQVQGGRGNNEQTINFNVDRITPADGTLGVVTITHTDDQNLSFSVPDVASWAQTESGSTIPIPRSKLPNLELGNTHTYTNESIDQANPNSAQIIEAIIDNDSQQRDTPNEVIAWHPGDLLVIAGVAGSAAGVSPVIEDSDDNNGIYVYVGPDQGSPADPTVAIPLTFQGTPAPTNPTDMQIFESNFRAVISADTQVQSTVARYSTDATTGMRSETQLGSLNSLEYADGSNDNTLQLIGSGGTIDIAQAAHVSDAASNAPDAVLRGFINNIKIGQSIFRFGPEAGIPQLRFGQMNQNLPLYSSNAQSLTFPISGTQDANINGVIDTGRAVRAADILNETVTDPVASAGARGMAMTAIASDNTVGFTIDASTPLTASTNALVASGTGARVAPAAGAPAATDLAFGRVVTAAAPDVNGDRALTPVPNTTGGSALPNGERVTLETNADDDTVIIRLSNANNPSAGSVTFDRIQASGPYANLYFVPGTPTTLPANAVGVEFTTGNLVLTPEVLGDESRIQDVPNARFTFTSDADVRDAGVPSIIYPATAANAGEPEIADITGTVTFVNRRRAPTSSVATNTQRSILDRSDIVTTVNTMTTDASIAAGLCFDVDSVAFNARGLATPTILPVGSNGIVTATQGMTTDFYNTTGATAPAATNLSFSYTLATNPRNRQPNTPPPVTTNNISWFVPWFWFVQPLATAPNLSNVPNFNEFTQTANNRSFQGHTEANGVRQDIGGNSGDRIYIMIETSTYMRLVSDRNMRLVINANPDLNVVNRGVALSDVIEIPNAVHAGAGDTANLVSYTVVQFGQFDINRPAVTYNVYIEPIT